MHEVPDFSLGRQELSPLFAYGRILNSSIFPSRRLRMVAECFQFNWETFCAPAFSEPSEERLPLFLPDSGDVSRRESPEPAVVSVAADISVGELSVAGNDSADEISGACPFPFFLFSVYRFFLASPAPVNPAAFDEGGAPLPFFDITTFREGEGTTARPYSFGKEDCGNCRKSGRICIVEASIAHGIWKTKSCKPCRVSRGRCSLSRGKAQPTTAGQRTRPGSNKRGSFVSFLKIFFFFFFFLFFLLLGPRQNSALPPARSASGRPRRKFSFLPLFFF